MAEKTNARKSSTRRFAIGFNAVTGVILVAGALLIVAVFFGYTKNVLSAADERGQQLTQLQKTLQDTRDETSQWKANDPALLDMVAQVRAVEAATTRDASDNGNETKAAAAADVDSVARAVGLPKPDVAPSSNVNVLQASGATGLSYYSVAVKLTGSLNQISAFTNQVQSGSGRLVTIDAATYKRSSDTGTYTAWVRLNYWFTSTTPLFGGTG
jgi:Tfp pilus assembly protein PilO